MWPERDPSSLHMVRDPPHQTTCLCGKLDWVMGFPGGAKGLKEKNKQTNTHLQCRRLRRPRFNPWVGKIPWRRAWQPTPVFFPGESQGQRSLAGYSPWGCKESELQQLNTHTHSIQDSYKIVFIVILRFILNLSLWIIWYLNLSQILTYESNLYTF